MFLEYHTLAVRALADESVGQKMKMRDRQVEKLEYCHAGIVVSCGWVESLQLIGAMKRADLCTISPRRHK